MSEDHEEPGQPSIVNWQVREPGGARIAKCTEWALAREPEEPGQPSMVVWLAL